MKLTPPQIDAYHRDGFVILRNALEKGALQRVSQGLLRVIHAGKATGRGDPYPAPARLFTVNGAVQDDPDLLFIAEHPTIVRGAETLLGGPVSLSAFVGYLKTPGAAGTKSDHKGSSKRGDGDSAVHCDYKTYQQAGSSLNWLFAILPLVDLDEQTGPLWVAPGSHRLSRVLPAVDGQRVRRVQRAAASQLSPKVDSKLRRGDLLFMNMFTWHEGGANRADHDRLGIYNKYRALNSPPACGPNLFSNAARDALSPQGRRLLPHTGDGLRSARLIIEHDGRVLLTRNGRQWHLPSGPIAVDKTNMDMANFIAPLEHAVNEQIGLEVRWMTFIGDFSEAGLMCRVYAHALAASPNINPKGVTEVQWFTPQQIEEELVPNGVLEGYVLDAIRCWHDDSIVRGVGESGQRAKRTRVDS